MSRFAEGTTITIDESCAELQRLAARYEVRGFCVDRHRDGSGIVTMAVSGKPVRIFVPPPPGHSAEAPAAYRNEARRRWRAVCLLLKARFEAAASGISTLEKEFSCDLVRVAS